MTRLIRLAVCLFAAGATALEAQPVGPLQVRTFILQNITPEDAAALIAPYVDYTEQGGVFRAAAVRGVTVRAGAVIMARVDSLLKASDRPPASVRLKFQVIAALDSAVPVDPALGGLEGELRSVLRFNGYRLLAQGVLSTSDDRASELSLAAGKTEPFTIQTFVNRIESADKGSVRMNLVLRGWPFTNAGEAGHMLGKVILSTGITVPFGQSIVVGSGSGTIFPDGSRPVQQALLLVVRADPVTGKP